MKKSINGVMSDMTSEEETEINNLKAKAIEARTAQEAEDTAKADLKASAKAKLIAGEALTEAEANTIVL
jgi:hypothetical protein